MPSIMDILGRSILRSDGTDMDTSDLMAEGKIVGLFFSANWCPPCKGFTPKVAEFYEKYKSTDQGSRLEIVFISSDRDEQAFQEYFQEMPWCALPFADRDRKVRLSKRYKVQGIPALVFIEGKTGKLVTKDGRNNIVDDPEGKAFPWYPRPTEDIMRGPLQSHMGDKDMQLALKGKVKALYFSAHWCPPCRGFTPTLTDIYKKLNDAGRNFEVVFVSSDRSEESFNDYFSTMPWLAVPYGDNRAQDLAKHFGVQGIPTLLILDENNEIIATNGRALITKDPEGKEFPWPPKPLNELNDITAPSLNESACLIYFTDGEEEAIVKAKKLLQDIAQKYTEEQKASRNTDNELPELTFLYEGAESEEIADSLRSLGDLPDHTPLVAILDIPEEQVYAFPDGKDITAETIQEFVQHFRREELKYKSIQALRR